MASPAEHPDLLDAARGALERFGYAGATLERIAAEAGVSRVTLHRRGVTKDGLLAELVARADGSLRPVEPHESATALFNLVGWTYVHMRTGHGWAPERARAAVLDPVLNGLLVNPLPDGPGSALRGGARRSS
jgi:AcrR family transcriptional regulator